MVWSVLRGDFEEPIVPGTRHGQQPGSFHLRPHVRTELAVDSRPDLVVVPEREAGIDDGRCRHQGCEDRGGLVEEFDSAVAHLGQEVDVGSQLVGREQADLQAPVGCRANAVDGLLRALVDWVARVLAGCQLVGELRRSRSPGQNREERQRRRAGENRATGDALGLLVLLLHGLAPVCRSGCRAPRCAQWINMPPFTSRVTPVQYLASGLARNTMQPATSAGSPMRFSGICSRMPFMRSSGISPLLMSVAMRPGVTQLTRMPSMPNSRAIARARPSTPAFAAE